MAAADADALARSPVGEDEGSSRDGVHGPESAGMPSSEVEMLVDLRTVESAGSVGAGRLSGPSEARTLRAA